MAVRDYRELSPILKEIAMRLLSDQTLCKLLYYNDGDPLGRADIPNTKILLNERIRFIPKVGPQDVNSSTIVIIFRQGLKDSINKEILNLVVEVHVYTPMSAWVIKGDDLRIFLIMSRIEKLLGGKDINGIGKINSNGFEMDLTTDELSSYRMDFYQDVFS